MIAIVRKLNTDQQKKVLVDYIAGKPIGEIAKEADISVRSTYNLLGKLGAHRCRCGDIHERSA